MTYEELSVIKKITLEVKKGKNLVNSYKFSDLYEFKININDKLDYTVEINKCKNFKYTIKLLEIKFNPDCWSNDVKQVAYIEINAFTKHRKNYKALKELYLAIKKQHEYKRKHDEYQTDSSNNNNKLAEWNDNLRNKMMEDIEYKEDDN